MLKLWASNVIPFCTALVTVFEVAVKLICELLFAMAWTPRWNVPVMLLNHIVPVKLELSLPVKLKASL